MPRPRAQRVAADVWDRFTAAGYSEQNALDVVLGVGQYLLSTFTNLVTRAEVDPPFAAHAWHRGS